MAGARNDRGRKRELLGRHAVREYWLVDPEAPRVEVYSLNEGALTRTSSAEGTEMVASPLLPALTLRVADLVPTV